MHIANPIYDTVFKFLMEDTPSAILLLSTIIEEPIVSLEFLPQENIQQLEQRSLTVYRLDFCAKIKTPQGYKQVLIEIQKAKLPSDIMRFRRYLGEQYSKKSNCYEVIKEGKKPTKPQYKPLPIVSIYFLGYPLEHIKVPVIKVNRHYYDVVGRQEIDLKEEFIESLTHDSYVIQISQLRDTHKSEIEQLLAIFDQHKHLESDEHILDINENDYPDKYRSLIRRLQQAIAEPDIRRNMDTEDEILADLQDMERVIEETKQELITSKQEIAEKDKLIAELQQRLNNEH
ncbi:MAG: hypothetical protein GQ569_07520 [Methylococcaceae bacterium]|nr:hypothetical protein [Methylococcaceae bacterium]